MERERASSCDGGGATWFFSSYGGLLELRRGIQAASCVGPGKSNLPFELRRKAGDCSDRKSTRLNSSHHSTSYAVFCLKKKKQIKTSRQRKDAKQPRRTLLWRASNN